MVNSDQAAQTDLRCKKCLGRGYLVRGLVKGKILTRNCRRCNGCGQVQPGQRNYETRTPLKL